MKKLRITILLVLMVSAVSLEACARPIQYIKESNGARFSLSCMDDYGLWQTVEISCEAQDLTVSSRSNSWVTDNRYYDFLGATDSNGVQYFGEDGYRIEGTEIAEGAYLTAQYSPRKMTFLLDARGGSLSTDEVYVPYGGEIEGFEVPAPPSPDMKFLGWYMPKYTYSWNSEFKYRQVTDSDGKALDDYRVLENKDGDGYEDKGGYELKHRIVPAASFGWCISGTFDGIIRLYAEWEKINYEPQDRDVKVRFEYGKGYSAVEREVEPGTSLEELPSPIKDKSDGTMVWGWTYEKDNADKMYNGEPINEPTTLYAIWHPYKPILLFSDGVMKKEVAIPEDGVLYTENDEFSVERHGYELAGWYDSEIGGNAVSVIRYATAPSALYARWRKVEYTVIYHTEGTLADGVHIERTFYDIESETFPLYDLTGVCPEHYVFLGWCTDAGLNSAPRTKIIAGSFGNLDLYPKFKGDDVKLTLDMQYTEDMKYNDGKGTMAVTVEYGSHFTIRPPDNLGYTFLGWYDAPEGGMPVTDSMGNSLSAWNSLQPCTLYARWVFRGEVVTARFVDGDSVLHTLPLCAGDTLRFPAAPKKEGYLFVGWYNESMDAQYFESDKIYADITLYAKWAEAEVSGDE